MHDISGLSQARLSLSHDYHSKLGTASVTWIEGAGGREGTLPPINGSFPSPAKLWPLLQHQGDASQDMELQICPLIPTVQCAELVRIDQNTKIASDKRQCGDFSTFVHSWGVGLYRLRWDRRGKRRNGRQSCKLQV